MTAKVETREALNALSKDELIARAEALGIDGARKFTKLELVDEITRASGTEARGLLGKARDLLRDVVERGLARNAAPLQPKVESGEATKPAEASAPEPPVPTVTLAEIYLAQGHLARAKAIAREILRTHPDDAAARAFLDRVDGSEAPTVPHRPVEGLFPDDPYAAIGIEREAFEGLDPVQPPPVPAMLDDAPFPARYDVDECVAMAVDPTTIYVYWEARRATIERARRVIRGEPQSVLRVLVVQPTDKGPHVQTRDFDIIDLEFGEWFVRDLPAGSIVRAAVGLRVEGRFLPVAHTLDVEAPWASPSSQVARDVVVWSEDGTRPKGEGSAMQPLARDAGMLGLPPLPEAPEPPVDDDEALGRGLSSAELARRRRIASARRALESPTSSHATSAGEGDRRLGASDQLARGPSSASFLGKT